MTIFLASALAFSLASSMMSRAWVAAMARASDFICSTMLDLASSAVMPLSFSRASMALEWSVSRSFCFFSKAPKRWVSFSWSFLSWRSAFLFWSMERWRLLSVFLMRS